MHAGEWGFKLYDGPNLKTLLIRWSGLELFISVSRLIGVQLVDYFCSSNPVVLFDNPGISKCIYTLFFLVRIFASF